MAVLFNGEIGFVSKVEVTTCFVLFRVLRAIRGWPFRSHKSDPRITRSTRNNTKFCYLGSLLLPSNAWL